MTTHKDDDTSSLQELFDDICTLIQETPVTPELQVPDSDKLKLYGLYKQATVGTCNETEAPSRFQLVARAKHQAWLDCREMSKQQAMLAYVQLASSHDHWLGSKCHEKVLDWKESSSNDGDTAANHEDANVSTSSTLSPSLFPKTSSNECETVPVVPSTTWYYSWLEKNLGIRPLIPRGQLDIDYQTLAFAAWQCIQCSSSTSRYSQLEQEVSDLWNDPDASIVSGLSVRSLLDLYLRAASFPSDSEIIVTPPINIPGMMQILKHHNLNVVPVDISKSKDDQCVVSVDVNAVKRAITTKTVAILIVHPFGMISTTNDDIAALSTLAKQNNLHLLEDCAECFTGFNNESCYKGSSEAGVSFFSFGTIKTATALGGGVAVVRHSQGQASKMKRMHYSLYKQQRAVEYLYKVLWCLVVKCIADCPLLYGALFALFSWLGLDFDAIVSGSTKSFSNVRASNDTMQYMQQLQRRPSTALLSVLVRRLRQSGGVVPSVTNRIKRCKATANMLKQFAPNVKLPVALSDSSNSYWLFPIQVDKPNAVSRDLRSSGFDVPRGLSQLECIAAKYSSNPIIQCDRTDELMNGILYLPVASRNMSQGAIRQIIVALNDATRISKSAKMNATESDGCFRACKCLQKQRNRFTRPNSVIAVAFAVVAMDALLSRGLPLSRFAFGAAITVLKLFVTVKCILLAAAVAITWTMADFYLKSSKCFAQYSSQFFQQETDDSDDESTSHGMPEAGNDSKPLLNMDALRLPSLATSVLDNESPMEDAAVLLTGATGFIGRLVLRDLLLHRKTLPIQGGVVVLCRPKREKSARDRISNLLDDPIYSFLSETEKRSLVRVVDGDVTKPNVGLSSEDYHQICNEVDITCVIHCAASVSFTQTLKEAAASNITSSLNLQSVTGRLKHRSARYIHISTAFVHGGLTGTDQDPLPEEMHALEGYDAADLYRSMLSTEYRASVAMNDLRFPNTYTFSKCICEHLLARNKSVPTVIVRPSIVGPALREPYEGWAGDKPTTIVAAACLYMSYQWNLWCFGNHRVPYIPIDVASKFILAKSFARETGYRRACDSPAAASASSSDDGFERVSQMSDSSFSQGDDVSATLASSCDERHCRSELFTIHNLTWDHKSPPSASFTWVEYAVAVTHLGAIFGHFSRLTAYIGLFVTVRVLPGMNVKEKTFRSLHRALVQCPIDTMVSTFKAIGWCPRPIKALSKLSSFLDLPLLFFQFMNSEYYFASDLVAPDELDGNRYLFSCATAAERFVASIKARHEKRASAEESPGTILSLGGTMQKPTTSDLLWALTQPRGGFFVRLAGWMFRKLLRASSVDVTIDAQSFALGRLAYSSISSRPRPLVVLAPNHRSFFDFLLISYLCFALPELQIEIPFIAAADDFERLPVIGWLATRANAFFLRRGRGKADPSLRATLGALKEDCSERGVCIEVFIEGSRSRDRRYLKPKTGLLRCLSEIGGDVVVIPISINYEEIPEQSNLACEVEHGQRAGLSSLGMLSWLKRVLLGKVNIGKIHVAAASPIHVDGSVDNDFSVLAQDIQRRQQDLTFVSPYHLLATSSALGLDTDTVNQALIALECNFWPGYECSNSCTTCEDAPVQPTSMSEKWMVLLQLGHKLSPYFETSHPKWYKWLNESGEGIVTSDTHDVDPFLQKLVLALGKAFDKADELVTNSLAKLRAKGFDAPEHEHVVQSILKNQVDCPTLLLRAAAFFELEGADGLRSESHSCDGTPLLINSLDEGTDGGSDRQEESLGFWGFRDSGFVLQMDRSGEASVAMKGERYGICGKSLKRLIPFIENETSTRIDLYYELSFSSSGSVPFPSDLMDADIDLLASTFTKVSASNDDRIRHGTGHSQQDVYLIRSGAIDTVRVPDAVVWPSSEREVEQLVAMAKSNQWCLIPFGGGTNVSHATRCPTKETEPRPILSVDMRLMDRVLWVNEEDGLAHVQAGITGRALVEEMARRGYTIGHEPDSIEFSTLGGWIATKASGMKRNKYGNIEDIVKSVRVAGSEGLLWRGNSDSDTGPHGRESRGWDLLSIALGSEGSFGIITSAVVRIWPLPECQEHDSVLFPDFEHGLRFARDVARLGLNLPSSVRLLDNEHFRLGQALQGESSVMERGLTSLWKMVHPVNSSFSPDSVVCATVLFEGTRGEVQTQRRAIKTLASKHGGTCVGARVGKAGYELTFAIAYLRDFALTYNFLAESFETFAPWSKVERIIEATKERIRREHQLRCLPGEPFIGSRVTQLYHEGACLYFYFCMSIRGVKNPSVIFAEIEHAARQEILDNGGSLSHHHGIGKLRSDFTKEMDSDSYKSLLASLKESIDPSNTFGVRNGALSQVDASSEEDR